MIDSHSHTFYSKHAIGTVDELVRASIAAGVTVLTITDHAPFPVDMDNRLLASELDRLLVVDGVVGDPDLQLNRRPNLIAISLTSSGRGRFIRGRSPSCVA